MDAMFDGVARETRDELGARNTVDQEIEKIERSTREKMEEHFLPIKQGHEPESVYKAFKERFDEIKLHQMRRTIPALLALEQKGPFIDPAWDDRDDPVPVWVTLVHVGFQ